MDGQQEVWDTYYRRTRWKKESVRLPQVLHGKRVLELGVGNGKTLRSMLRQKPFSITAIDISGEAIKLCKKAFGDSVELLQADATTLPFADASFDVVVCYYILNNVLQKEREKVVKEIFRVLTDGGTLLFEDFAVGDFREASEMKKVAGDAHSYVKSDGRYMHYFNGEALRELFRGFTMKGLEILERKPLRARNEARRIWRGTWMK